jgi:UDP-N-acetylmuramate--alanine ligase
MIVPFEGEIEPLQRLGRVHFVGIGGAGMSVIARIMLSRGVEVTGSDAKDSPALAELRDLGATVYVGHDAAHVGDADTVVLSTAIRETNPEFTEARSRGLRLLPRAAALASVMRGSRVAAVAGTHGKTTTTSMLAIALRHCGFDPTFAIGGLLADSGVGAHDGAGDIFVAEADESDGSFLLYTPAVAVVTNVEPDHLDHYGTPEAVAEAFAAFARRIESGGSLVTCGDDIGAKALAETARRLGVTVVTYGQDPRNDLRILDIESKDGGSSFELTDHQQTYGRFWIRVPGQHNVLNATAAFLAGQVLGAPPDCLRSGLAEYAGVRRRFDLVGAAADVRLVDDYSHHPTEVAVILRAAREVVGPGGRVIAVFQPHLYSRTRIFAADFGRALGMADKVVVMDVYPAREDPEPGVDGSLIAKAVPLPAEAVQFAPDWTAVPALVASLARPGDLVLTIGAGDVTQIGPHVLELLGTSAIQARDE